MEQARVAGEKAHRAADSRTKLRFYRGASEEQLRKAEGVLGVSIQKPLREVLAQSNGVLDLQYINGRWIPVTSLVWKLDEIVKQHRSPYRDALGPPRPWLVFVSAGVDGIVFGYDTTDVTERIWAWHPMEKRRQLLARTFAGFFHRWLAGGLTLR